MNLRDLFLEKAEKQPHKSAIIGPKSDQVLTYSGLKDEIFTVVEKLSNLGIKKGSFIGLMYPSGLEYIILAYAIWVLDSCIIPIATELADEEKKEIIKDIPIDFIITNKNRTFLNTENSDSQSHFIQDNILVIPQKNTKKHPKELYNLNPAFIRFTSGTTSKSKGVVLSHQTVFDRIHAANQALAIDERDTIIWLLSMSYHFTVSIVSYLSFGASIVLLNNHFGKTILEKTIKHNGTLIYGSPVHFEQMANAKNEENMNSLRLAISTTAALSKEIADAFYERFNKGLHEAYGIIEVGLPCINIKEPVQKMGSVGKPLPAYELSFIESDELEQKGARIKVRGKGIVDAYYSPWRSREELTDNGWFITGDYGYLDKDGYLFILGRTAEVINVAGKKVFPGEIEHIFENHVAVKEACAFPSFDKRFGEIPCINVVLNEEYQGIISQEELLNYCMKHLASYKIPQEVYFVDQIKKTASGKKLRHNVHVKMKA